MQINICITFYGHTFTLVIVVPHCDIYPWRHRVVITHLLVK